MQIDPYLSFKGECEAGFKFVADQLRGLRSASARVTRSSRKARNRGREQAVDVLRPSRRLSTAMTKTSRVDGLQALRSE
jgi:hypothetical protein